jgi:hypothetical protein
LELSEESRKERNDTDRDSEPGGREEEGQIGGIGNPGSMDSMGTSPKENKLDGTMEVGAVQNFLSAPVRI